MEYILTGSLAPFRGIYVELLENDWPTGLVTYINEVLWIYSYRNIQLIVQFVKYFDPTLKLEPGLITVYTKDKNLTLPEGITQNKHISIINWPCCLPCQNANIETLELNLNSGTPCISPQIKNNKIKYFKLALNSKVKFDLIKQLENFDQSQVETFVFNNNGYDQVYEYLKYLLYKGNRVEPYPALKFFTNLNSLCFYMVNIELIDASLFQDIEKFFNKQEYEL
jgi:hypothetical protein